MDIEYKNIKEETEKASYKEQAFHKDKLIGFLHAHLVFPEMEIIHIEVDENYRKQGIGQQLIKSFIEKYTDIEKIYLEVSRNNTKAIRFYQKIGFIENGTRKKYYKDGSDAILMYKALNQRNFQI